jgi:large subunit ribosomal protein L5
MEKKHLSLKEKYLTEVRPALMKEYGLKSPLAAPRLSKIVVNMGTGELLRNKESREKLMKDLAAITGQKPKVQPAKISVAGFGIRAGMPVGLSVTLRKSRMYDFLERLISIVLPRLRDFRGVSLGSFDRFGNYTMGLSEHSSFPEIDIAKTEKPQSLEVTIVTTGKNIGKSRRLLELLGVPFAKEKNG